MRTVASAGSTVSTSAGGAAGCPVVLSGSGGPVVPLVVGTVDAGPWLVSRGRASPVVLAAVGGPSWLARSSGASARAGPSALVAGLVSRGDVGSPPRSHAPARPAAAT